MQPHTQTHQPESTQARSTEAVLTALSAAIDIEVAAHATRTAAAPREARALTMFDMVPAGHLAVPVTDERWEPHLRPGEFAVLDVADIEPQLGELYGLTIQSPRMPGGHILKLVQPVRSGFGSPDSVVFGFRWHRPGTLLMIDGPLSLDGWHRTCRGRVVGVLAPIGGEASHG